MRAPLEGPFGGSLEVRWDAYWDVTGRCLWGSFRGSLGGFIGEILGGSLGVYFGGSVRALLGCPLEGSFCG